MISLLSPAYLPPIKYVAWLQHQEKVYFNTSDHYQKQTFRNRCEILGANGVLKLSIPIKHQSKKIHQKEKSVEIHNEVPWQKQHWKSISIAYRSAPFFEFYEPELLPYFETPQLRLWDWNIALMEKILSLIELPFTYELMDFDSQSHLRMEPLLDAKTKEVSNLPEYKQVFSEKFSFQGNLSIVDLLFNLGPQCEAYLKKIPTN